MWNYIEAADWATNSQKKKGYDITKTFFLANYTQTLMAEINQFVQSRNGELNMAIEAYEADYGRVGQYGGDDSYSDMIYHAIGLGEAYFNSVVANPKLLNDLEIVESFAYSLPYEDDYQVLDIDYHKKLAIKALQAITEIMVSGKANIEDVETMRQMQNRFMLMATGDLAEATRGFDERRYDEYYKFKANTYHAMFSNYLSDAKNVAHLVK